MKKIIIFLILIFSLLTCVRYRTLPMPGFPSMFFSGFIGIIVFVGLIVALIYLLIDRDNLIKKVNKERPLDILKKRYARGEITKREFDKMKQEIE